MLVDASCEILRVEAAIPLIFGYVIIIVTIVDGGGKAGHVQTAMLTQLDEHYHLNIDSHNTHVASPRACNLQASQCL